MTPSRCLMNLHAHRVFQQKEVLWLPHLTVGGIIFGTKVFNFPSIRKEASMQYVDYLVEDFAWTK